MIKCTYEKQHHPDSIHFVLPRRFVSLGVRLRLASLIHYCQCVWHLMAERVACRVAHLVGRRDHHRHQELFEKITYGLPRNIHRDCLALSLADGRRARQQKGKHARDFYSQFLSWLVAHRLGHRTRLGVYQGT